jgi:glycosidase
MIKHITQDDIIYFIITDRFYGRNKTSAAVADNKIHGGTLDGIIDKLDYLVELGITAIWITPVYENIADFYGSEPYHYYWPKNFEKIDSRLLDGSRLAAVTNKNTLSIFVETCESRGIKVILDMVVNHAGYGAKANFDAAWFNVGGKDEIKGELAGLPDFNHDNPEVLDYFINNVAEWKTKGKITNIRMDTVKHVEPKFWHFFKSQIKGEFPDTNIIGEVLCEGKEDVQQLLQYQNFHDFNSIFDFPLCTAIRSVFIYDESIKYWLARPRLHEAEPLGVLDNDNPMKGGYRNANQLVTLLDNHDLQKRIMSHARSKHTGEAEGLQWAVKVTKLCLGALFTMRGIPQLYYGTELGIEGWKSEAGDADLRRDFPWEMIQANHHPDANHITASVIYRWTKELIHLRKKSAALKYGTTLTLWSDDLLYAFVRVSVNDAALVIINNGYAAMKFPVRIHMDKKAMPERLMVLIKHLRHWQTSEVITTEGDDIIFAAEAKSIAIYC